MTSPLVYIVVLNWNGWQDTLGCIESCLQLTYPRYRILIVDNGSTDASVGNLLERFPDIAVLQTGKNLGFAGGNNIGIRHAFEQGADYVWLLNNDTIVDPSALTELVSVGEASDAAGIVGSKIFFFSQPDVIWFAGGLIRHLSGASIHRGHLEKDEGRYDDIAEVDYITGCSLLIKREVVDKIGLMDDRFFLLFEEADWNLRAKKQGYKILYVPFSKVWHKVSASIGAESPNYHYYLARNSLLFTLKHKRAYVPLVTMSRLMDIAYFLFHKRFTVARAALGGILDFHRFRFGKRGAHSP
jgi:GT2 family glycosyltransferase